MEDFAARTLLVLGVVAAAVVAGRIMRRWQRPTHPPVDLAGLSLPPGIIAFTSTQCDNCKKVMAIVGSVGVPVREVTHELEGPLFDSARVEAVPLLVVTDRSGVVVRQLAGTPSKAAVRRAVHAAGW